MFDSQKNGQEDIKALLSRVRRIEIAAQRLVNEQLSGRYHSVFKGRGMSFEEVRPYSPGDEVRLIDWNVSARTGEVFVKQFVEERELTVLILADASASMDFGLSKARYRTVHGEMYVEDTKRELAAQIAAAVALSAQMNNDRVGLVTFGSHVQTFIPPRKGRRHALRVIREVLAMKAEGAPTDLASALGFVGRVLKRRAAVFIVSDFEVPDFEGEMRVAARRHDLHAFVVRDPFEQALISGGLIPMRDAETKELRFVKTTKRCIEDYREAVANHLNRVEQVFKRLKVPYTLFSTDRSYEKPLAKHFAKLKGKSL